MGMFMQEVGSFTYSANKLEILNFDKIPARGPNGHQTFLKALEFIVDAQFDTGATAATVEDHHALISAVTVKAKGKAYGPDGLTGLQLAAIDAWQSGKALKFIDNGGDAAIATTQCNVARLWLTRFDYGKIGGKPTDYAPPVAFLKNTNGVIEFKYGSYVANGTVDQMNVRVIAHLIESPDLRAVPRIRYYASALSSASNERIGRGAMRFLALQNSGDWAAADLTSLRLFADGTRVHDLTVDFEGQFNATFPYSGDNAELQFHGFDSVGNGNPRFLGLMPLEPGPYPIGSWLKADDWTLTLAGGETMTNVTVVRGLVEELLDLNTAIDQMADCGICEREELENLVSLTGGKILAPKTISKVPFIRPGIAGVMPLKAGLSALDTSERTPAVRSALSRLQRKV